MQVQNVGPVREAVGDLAASVAVLDGELRESRALPVELWAEVLLLARRMRKKVLAATADVKAAAAPLFDKGDGKRKKG